MIEKKMDADLVSHTAASYIKQCVQDVCSYSNFGAG
jgi:hypothetical protein